MSTQNLILLYAELSSKSFLQASRVKSSKRSELVGLQSRVNKSGKSGNVCGVKDNYHMLYVRAVLLDIVAKLSSNLAVPTSKSSRVMPSLRGAPPEEMMYLAPVKATSGSTV